MHIRQCAGLGVLHLRVLLRVAVHHGSLGVIPLVHHLGSVLGTIVLLSDAHGHVVLLLVMYNATRGGHSLGRVHIRTGETTIVSNETRILCERRKLDRRSAVGRTSGVGRVVRDKGRGAFRIGAG